MRAVVKKWGNSAAVRIPAPLLEAVRFAVDQAVDIREENGRIIVEAIRKEEYDLETLVAGITDDNRHEEWDTGPPVGREIW